MLPRFLKKIREKLLFTCIILVTLVGTIYLYVTNLQEYYRNVKWSEQRCRSELSSVKYQLNGITEYKNKIDKLLTDTQKAYDLDKERCRESLESCHVIKQQSALCQSQFEDLQAICRKTKQSLSQLIKDLDKPKETADSQVIGKHGAEVTRKSTVLLPT